MAEKCDKHISEARFHQLFNDTDAMSIQGYRADGTVVYWNAASEKVYGYSTQEALGKSLYDLIIPDEMRTEVKQAVAWMFEHQRGIPAERLNLKHKDGSTVPVFSSHTVVALPNDEPIMFCMDADMRALTVAEEQVQRLSYFDPLTELPNRRLLLERLASITRPHNGDDPYAALLIIDIDNFHSINESLGYSNGDRVLTHCARCVERFATASDNVARLGKDEFVLILTEPTPSLPNVATKAEQLAVELLQALETPLKLDGSAHKLKACVGITLFECPSSLPGDEILRQADIALKAAKRSQHANIRFFDQQLETEVKERLHISQALGSAIEKHELSLALQPQVNRHGQLVGFEALLRWQNAELGKVPPAEFIPIAEDTGSIISIGDWVLRQSCEQLVEWAERPDCEHLTLSVNVSPVQFRRGDFVARLQQILKTTGASPANLRLELTESLMADDIDFVVKQMRSLRELGVTLSLDDFGTGYASLAYLTQLPIQELKIDRVFVNDLNRHGKGELLAETLITLGRSMNLVVIAEGVETHQQFERLQELGCEFFQGYLFGKPHVDSETYVEECALPR